MYCFMIFGEFFGFGWVLCGKFNFDFGGNFEGVVVVKVLFLL